MSSNQLTPTTSLTGKKKIAIITIAILAIAIAASVTYGLLASNPTTNNNATNQQSDTKNIQDSTSWMKKGAYATYQGDAEIMAMSFAFNAKMEISDLNSTHLQISTTFDMSSPYGSIENTTSSWVSRDEMNFQPEGLELYKTYNTQISLPNVGTRSCTVYEYENEDIKTAFYVDNVLKWPVKITMSSPVVEGQSYNMDVTLTDSNIPGL